MTKPSNPEPDAAGFESGNQVRDAARQTWGDKPAGSSYAAGLEPGTKAFFEAVVDKRFNHEMPWLKRYAFDADLENKKVIEVGCGAGYDAYMFTRAGAKYTGVDLTPANIERTRSHLELFGLASTVVVGDAEHLDVDDARFDMYFSNGVLHHVHDFGSSLAEAYRVLKPGGRMLILVYHKHSLFYWTFLYLYKHLYESRRSKSVGDILSEIEFNTVDARPLVRVYTRSSLRNEVARAGFEKIAISVEKFRKEDVPQVRGVRQLMQVLPTSWCDAIGRVFGWYLVCEAVKPD